MNDLKNTGGLWLQVSKNDEEYFTGKIGEQKILIFKNKQKKSDKHPDYLVYAEQVTEKQTNKQKINDIFNDSDIPF